MEKRLTNIDIFKGFGILLVIISHIWVGDNPYRMWCSAFYMPMFFFVSGFLFHEYEPVEFIKRKFKSLIIPYFFFGVLNLVACLLMIKHFDVLRYMRQIFYINNNPSLPITGALWFLTALFFADIIFYFSRKYLKKYFLELLIIALVGILYLVNVKLPYSIDCAIYMLPFFYMGYRYKDVKEFSNKVNIFIVFVLSVLSALLIFKNGMVNVRVNTYNNIFLFYINATMMSLCFFKLSKLIQDYKLLKPIEYVGKNSLIFMCIHQIIMYYFIKIAKIPSKFVVLTLILVCVTIIVEIWKKCKHSLNKNSQT